MTEHAPAGVAEPRQMLAASRARIARESNGRPPPRMAGSGGAVGLLIARRTVSATHGAIEIVAPPVSYQRA